MRTIKFNGYIDEEVWWGDEITPEMLHDQLYGENGDLTDDVSILVNSYGGSCNAATQMFDDINAYPGKVTVKLSGTAASAATVFIQAADVVEITQGSLMMIHDPSTIAFGNEADMDAAKDVLKACKQAILNCYAVRAKASREELSDANHLAGRQRGAQERPCGCHHARAGQCAHKQRRHAARESA